MPFFSWKLQTTYMLLAPTFRANLADMEDRAHILRTYRMSLQLVALLLLLQCGGLQGAARALQSRAVLQEQRGTGTWVSWAHQARTYKRIAVVGERHSGRTYLKTLLEANFNLEVSDAFCDQGHCYQRPGASCPHLDDTVVVVMFRNPYDWVFDMQQNCQCGDEAVIKQTAAMDFKAFLDQPFPDTSPKTWMGENEITSCGTLLQCRALKLINFLNITSWAPNVEFLRYEDIMTAKKAEHWLSSFVARWQLSGSQSSKGVRHLAASMREEVEQSVATSLWFNPHYVNMDSDVHEKAHLITERMDVELERMVGYAPVGDSSSPRIVPAIERIMKERNLDPGYQLVGNHAR